MTDTNQNNQMSEKEKEKKIQALLEETQIKLDAFNWEAEERVKRISKGIEEAKHHLNVAEHEIGKEMVNCLKKISNAEDSIMLPEEA